MLYFSPPGVIYFIVGSLYLLIPFMDFTCLSTRDPSHEAKKVLTNIPDQPAGPNIDREAALPLSPATVHFPITPLQNSPWKRDPWNLPIIWRNAFNPHEDNRNRRNSWWTGESHASQLFSVHSPLLTTQSPLPHRTVTTCHLCTGTSLCVIHSLPRQNGNSTYISSVCVNHKNP